MPIDGTISTDVLDGGIDSAAEALLSKWGLNKDGEKSSKKAARVVEEPREEDEPEDAEAPELLL